MGTTVQAVLIAARAKLATIPTSRDAAEFYLEHKTNQPFAKSPISRRDGFEIVSREWKLTSAFGITGDKEHQFNMVVRLGHAPFATDDDREKYRVQDIQRVADLLEAYAWPDGTQVVLFDREEVNKESPEWWLTEMFFKVVLTGAIETS